jgi:hypothetical protein
MSTGLQMETEIKEIRTGMQGQRANIKIATDQLNAIKQEIDNLKSRLDKKEDERRLKQGYNDEKHEELFEDKSKEDDIIDEEELYLLKQMKDYKK